MPGEIDSSIDAAQAELATQATKENEVKNQEMTYQHLVDAFQDISANLNLSTPEAGKVLDKGKGEVTALLQRMAARGRLLIANEAYGNEPPKAPDNNPKNPKEGTKQKPAPMETARIDDLASSLRSTLNTYATKLTAISQIVTKKQEAFNLLNAAYRVESSADVVNVAPFVPPLFVEAIDKALYGANGDGGCMSVYKMLRNNSDLPKEFVTETLRNIEEKQTNRLLELKIRGQQQVLIDTLKFGDAVLGKFVTMDAPKKPGDKPTFTFTQAGDSLSREQKEQITSMIMSVRAANFEQVEAATCPPATQRFWDGKALFEAGQFHEAKITIQQFLAEDLSAIGISSDPKLKGKLKVYEQQAKELLAQLDKVDGANKDFFSAQELLQGGDIVGAKKLLKKYLAEHKEKKEGETDFTGSAKELLKRIAISQVEDARAKFLEYNKQPPQKMQKTVAHSGSRAGHTEVVDNPDFVKWQRYAEALATMEREINAGKYFDYADAYNAVSAQVPGGFDSKDEMNMLADQLILDKGREGLLELARRYRERGKFFGDPKFLQLAEQYFQEYFSKKLGETAKKQVTIEQLRMKYYSNPSFQAGISDKVVEAKKQYDEKAAKEPDWAQKNPWNENKVRVAVENQALGQMQHDETIKMQNSNFRLNPANVGDAGDQTAWGEFMNMKGQHGEGKWFEPFALSDEQVGRMVKDLPVDIAMIAAAGALAAATGGAASGVLFSAMLSTAERQALKVGAQFAGRKLLAAAAGFAIETALFTASHSVMKGIQTGHFSVAHFSEFMDEWLQNIKVMGVLGATGRIAGALRICGPLAFGVEMASMGMMNGKLTVDDFAMILGLKLGHAIPAGAKRGYEAVKERNARVTAERAVQRGEKMQIFGTEFAPTTDAIPAEMRGKPAYIDTSGKVVIAPNAFAELGVTTTSRNGENIFIVESSGGPYRGAKVEMPAKEFLRIIAKEQAGKPLTAQEQALLPTVQAVRAKMDSLIRHEKNHRVLETANNATKGRLGAALEKLFNENPELKRQFEERSSAANRAKEGFESIQEFLSEVADGSIKLPPEQRALLERTITREGKIRDRRTGEGYSFDNVRKADTRRLVDPALQRAAFNRERAAGKDTTRTPAELRPSLTPPESHWELQVREQMSDIRPTKSDPNRPWIKTHFEITRPDGTKVEIKAEDSVMQIRSRSGQVIDIPAHVAEHIYSLHLKGHEAGSTFTQTSLADVMRSFAERMPAQVDPSKGATIDFGQVIGQEGITPSRSEMVERGVVTQQDLARLDTFKEEAFKLNLEGTEQEKAAFVERANQSLQGNVRLIVRANTITPLYLTERPATSLGFMAISSQRAPEGTVSLRVATIVTGRSMEKLPADRSFTGQSPTEGVAEGTRVAELVRREKAGAELTPAERSLVEAQKRAQECWWEGGFIRPPMEEAQKVSRSLDGMIAPGLYMDVYGREVPAQEFSVSPEQQRGYLDAVRARVQTGSHENNPYHNSQHFDEFRARAREIVTEAKTPEDQFVLDVVAQWHDFNHPGKAPAEGLSVNDVARLYEGRFTPEQIRDSINQMIEKDNQLLAEQNKGKDPKMQKQPRQPITDLEGKINFTPEEVSAFMADASLVTSGLNVSPRLRARVASAIKATDFANSRNYPKTAMEWQVKLADMANFMKPQAEWLATTVKVAKEAPWGLPSSVEKYLNGEIFFLEKLVKEAVIDNPATKGLFGENVTKPLEEKLNYLRERKAELERTKADKDAPQSAEFRSFVDAIKELFPNGVRVTEADVAAAREAARPAAKAEAADAASTVPTASAARPAGQAMSPEGRTFDTKNNTLLLKIDRGALNLHGIEEVARQNGFDSKGEIHLTVLSFKNAGVIKKVLSKLTPEARAAKLAEIQQLVENTDWNFVPQEGVYQISKEFKVPDPNNKGAEITELRESYIQRVDMPGMKEFYENLNRILGTKLEPPPPHVTLFTSGSNRESARMGIAINSEAELAQMNPRLVTRVEAVKVEAAITPPANAVNTASRPEVARAESAAVPRAEARSPETSAAPSIGPTPEAGMTDRSERLTSEDASLSASPGQRRVSLLDYFRRGIQAEPQNNVMPGIVDILPKLLESNLVNLSSTDFSMAQVKTRLLETFRAIETEIKGQDTRIRNHFDDQAVKITAIEYLTPSWLKKLANTFEQARKKFNGPIDARNPLASTPELYRAKIVDDLVTKMGGVMDGNVRALAEKYMTTGEGLRPDLPQQSNIDPIRAFIYENVKVFERVPVMSEYTGPVLDGPPSLINQRNRAGIRMVERNKVPTERGGVILDGNFGYDENGNVVRPDDKMVIDHHDSFESRTYDTGTIMSRRFWENNLMPSGMRQKVGEMAFLRNARGKIEVMINHLDSDSILSVWSFRNPNKAARYKSVVDAISQCGDFLLGSGVMQYGATARDYEYIIREYIDSCKNKLKAEKAEPLRARMDELARQRGELENRARELENRVSSDSELVAYNEQLRQVELMPNGPEKGKKKAEINKEKTKKTKEKFPDYAAQKKAIDDSLAGNKKESDDINKKMNGRLSQADETKVLNHMLDVIEDIITNPLKYRNFLESGRAKEQQTVRQVEADYRAGKIELRPDPADSDILLMRPGSEGKIPDYGSIDGMYFFFRGREDFNKELVVTMEGRTFMIAINTQNSNLLTKYNFNTLMERVRAREKTTIEKLIASKEEALATASANDKPSIQKEIKKLNEALDENTKGKTWRNRTQMMFGTSYIPETEILQMVHEWKASEADRFQQGGRKNKGAVRPNTGSQPPQRAAEAA